LHCKNHIISTKFPRYEHSGNCHAREHPGRGRHNSRKGNFPVTGRHGGKIRCWSNWISCQTPRHWL